MQFSWYYFQHVGFLIPTKRCKNKHTQMLLANILAYALSLKELIVVVCIMIRLVSTCNIQLLQSKLLSYNIRQPNPM